MDRNEEYGYGSFRTAAFGGFRKNDVLEYLDSLTEEIEQLRKDKKELESELADGELQLKQEKRRADKMERLLDEADKERAEMETQLNELDARTEEYDRLCEELKQQQEKTDYTSLKEECEQLRQQKHMLEQTLEKTLAETKVQEGSSEAEEHYKTLCLELEEHINTYEKRKGVVSDVLVNAKVEAQHILADADVKANYLIRQASQQAELKKKTAEALVQRVATQNIGQIRLIKQQLQEYLDILNNIYQGIGQARSGLSQSIIELPEDLDVFQRIAEGEIVLGNDAYRMDDIKP